MGWLVFGMQLILAVLDDNHDYCFYNGSFGSSDDSASIDSDPLRPRASERCHPGCIGTGGLSHTGRWSPCVASAPMHMTSDDWRPSKTTRSIWFYNREKQTISSYRRAWDSNHHQCQRVQECTSLLAFNVIRCLINISSVYSHLFN